MVVPTSELNTSLWHHYSLLSCCKFHQNLCDTATAIITVPHFITSLSLYNIQLMGTVGAFRPYMYRGVHYHSRRGGGGYSAPLQQHGESPV